MLKSSMLATYPGKELQWSCDFYKNIEPENSLFDAVSQ